MKKILPIILCITVLFFCAAGCSSADKNEKTTEAAATTAFETTKEYAKTSLTSVKETTTTTTKAADSTTAVSSTAVSTTKPKKTEKKTKTSTTKKAVTKAKKEKSELLICICEYSDIEELFYITIIKPFSPNIKYTIKSPQQKWKINFSAILNDSPYCITISQKPSTSLKNPILSHITFCKYPLETIVCQETLGSEITYGCFNPKNTLELIICGKGYLRLWNVFINEGTLKEHQHRFLRGKQEKEKTFIKAQFFTRKLFLLIVGTKENMFFIFEGYQLIHELNVCYSFENIYDLNIQNLRKFEEDDDITKLQEKIKEKHISVFSFQEGSS